MRSIFQATLSSDSFFGNPFETGFPPWETHEPVYSFEPTSPTDQEPVFLSPKPSQEPVSPNSRSDTSNPVPITPNSGSDDSTNGKRSRINSSSGSDRLGSSSSIDERKRRRMISNRESARRSRMRKQKHLENLRNQANRFKVLNRELMNRLRWVLHQNQVVRRENECLRSEAAVLRQRLWDIRQVLLVRQLQQHLNHQQQQTYAWPCNNVMTSINDHQGLEFPHHSIIT